MKKHHKITLASLATIIGILAGVLTVVEKSVALMAKAAPEREKRVIEKTNDLKELGVKYVDITQHDTDVKTGRAAK
jgi:hypothetical protein